MKTKYIFYIFVYNNIWLYFKVSEAIKSEQNIRCTVGSCKYNNFDKKHCNLKQIDVLACKNAMSGNPEDESMCGSYKAKNI